MTGNLTPESLQYPTCQVVWELETWPKGSWDEHDTLKVLEIDKYIFFHCLFCALSNVHWNPLCNWHCKSIVRRQILYTGMVVYIQWILHSVIKNRKQFSFHTITAVMIWALSCYMSNFWSWGKISFSNTCKGWC